MRYKITWTETSNHEVTLTAERVAEILGVEVDELGPIEEWEDKLDDALGELDHDGFISGTRDDVWVSEA